MVNYACRMKYKLYGSNLSCKTFKYKLLKNILHFVYNDDDLQYDLA